MRARGLLFWVTFLIFHGSIVSRRMRVTRLRRFRPSIKASMRGWMLCYGLVELMLEFHFSKRACRAVSVGATAYRSSLLHQYKHNASPCRSPQSAPLLVLKSRRAYASHATSRLQNESKKTSAIYGTTRRHFTLKCLRKPNAPHLRHHSHPTPRPQSSADMMMPLLYTAAHGYLSPLRFR